MKKWTVLILVGCLGNLPWLEVASANPKLLQQNVVIAAFPITQTSPTVVDRVWELVENARSLAKGNKQAQAISRLTQAFELAKTIPEKDTRNPILVKIIAEYGAIAAYPEAIAALSTLSYDEPLPDNQGYSVRMQGEVLITQAYVKAQQYEQALQFARNLQLDAAKERALLEIVIGYARQGRFEDAIALRQTLPADSYQRYLAESAILEEYIQRRQYAQALAFVQTIANTENRDSSVRSLAEAAWQSGRYDIALQATEKITNLSLQVPILKSLAQAHLAVGQKQQAATIISQAFELSKKTDEFMVANWVADFLATGQEERVKAIINGMTGNEYEMASNRSLIARAYLDTGRYTEAFEFAKLIPDRILLPLAEYPDPKVELFNSIIDQSLKARQYNFAQKVVSTLTNKDDQVKALQKIAQHYAETGQKQQATLVLNQALIIAKTIESISVVPERSLSWIEPNASILIPIAEDYLELGQKQQAMETLAAATESAQQFETQYAFDIPVWTRSRTLHRIASVYLKLGEPQKASELLALASQEVQTLKENDYIIKDLLGIAKTYVELGNIQSGTEALEKALPLLDTVELKLERMSLLIQIAKVFSTMGKQERGMEILKTALPLIETVEKEQEQVPLLIQAIGAYIQTGQTTVASQLIRRALPMIQRLEQDYERTRKLDELAIACSQMDAPTLALEVVQNVPKQVDKAQMLFAIVQQYAARNKTAIASEVLTQALTAANSIKDETQRNYLLTNTVVNLAQVYQYPHDFEAEIWQYNLAVPIAKALPGSETKAQILMQIALKYLKKGEAKLSQKTLADALEVVNKIDKSLQWQTKVWETIKVGLDSEAYDFVLQLANLIEGADAKAVALRQIAQNYAIAGNKQQATAVLFQAKQVANTIEDETAKQQAIAGIAQQQQQW